MHADALHVRERTHKLGPVRRLVGCLELVMVPDTFVCRDRFELSSDIKRHCEVWWWGSHYANVIVELCECGAVCSRSILWKTEAGCVFSRPMFRCHTHVQHALQLSDAITHGTSLVCPAMT